jgi:hypothetical protein
MNQGNLISEHPTDKNHYHKILIGGTLACVIFIALFIARGAPSIPYPAPVLAILGTIVGLPIILCLFVWYLYQLSRKREIKVYEAGVYYRDRNGESFWQWDAMQIQAVKTSGSVRQDFPPLLIIFENKQQVKLDGRYTNHTHLMSNILNKSLHQRNYESLYVIGQALSIGTAQVSQAGIEIKNKINLQWQDIYKIQHLNYNQLDIVRSNGKTETITLLGVADAPLLVIFLIQKVQGVATNEKDAKQTSKPQLADSLRSRLVVRGSIYSIVFAITLLAISIYVYGTGIANLITYSYIPRNTYLAGLAGALAPIMSLWFLYVDTCKLLAREAVVVNTEGLQYSNRSGEQFWKWEEIVGGRIMKEYSRIREIRIGYEVIVDNETVLRLHPQFERYNEVVNSIQTHHTNAHYEAAIARINSSEVLNFEPVVVDQFGIRYQGKSYLWETLRSVEFSNASGETNLIINSKNIGEFRLCISIFGMMNANLLYQLLNQRLTGARPVSSINTAI